jgi:glycosyltransferase involved in cell wall biosynthesis
LDGRRRRLIFSGRLVPEKRVDLLIDAFVAIASERPQWDLLIAGDGVLHDELHRRVPEALQQRVVWTGFLDRGEPALAYHSADVLVLPSDNEPWALVVPEAMAAGLVVVSSNIPGASYELVEDGRTGRIFPAGNLEELKHALHEVTADEALPRFKAESRALLARYLEKVDPVAEVRRALVNTGVLKASPSQHHADIVTPALGR